MSGTACAEACNAMNSLLPSPTLYGALDWMLGIHGRRCTPATLLMHRRHVQYIKAALPDRPLAEMTYALLWKWINDQVGGGLRMNTIIKRLCTMKIALREAVNLGLLPTLPPWPELRNDYEPRERYLTWAEYQEIRLALPLDRRLWLDVCLWTGVHRSDVDRFTWADVNLVSGRFLRRNTKNHARPVWLVMPRQLRALLTEAHARRMPGRGRVAAGWRHVWRDLARLTARLGIPPLCPTDLRRTLATWWIEEGGSRESLKTYLGHSKDSPMVDQVYARTTPAMLDDGIAALARKGDAA